MNFEDLEKAKRIRVYRNGDEHFPGVTVTLGKRQVTTMRSLLDLVTRQTHANEAVRRLCTPDHGTSVRSLDEVEDGAIYVAVGNRFFKKTKYTTSGNYARANQPEQKKENQYNNDSDQDWAYYSYSGHTILPRGYLQPVNVVSIRVYANGKDMEAPKRVVLTHHMLRSWFSILEEITAKVEGLNGAATSLFTVDGKRVKDPRDLISGESYVAVGTDYTRFKRLNYGQSKPVFASGRVNHRYLSPLPDTARYEEL